MAPNPFWNLTMVFLYYLCMGFNNVFAQDFSYDGDKGPDHWGEQYNACQGKYQSPINIDPLIVRKVSLPPLQFSAFNVKPARTMLQNNGHTVQVTMDLVEQLKIRGGALVGTYSFAQFHFHWGDNDTYGSEDRLDNRSYPIELHMVFYNEKYKEYNKALQYSDGITVLAFFYEISNSSNIYYEEFTKLLTQIVKPHTNATFMKSPRIMDLISKDTTHYYLYNGSLTTPPCSEVVTWIDFSEPIPISAQQIVPFRSLVNSEGLPLTHNFRPIQPLNGRIVYANVATKEMPKLSTDGEGKILNDISYEGSLMPAAKGGQDTIDTNAQKTKKNSCDTLKINGLTVLILMTCHYLVYFESTS